MTGLVRLIAADEALNACKIMLNDDRWSEYE